MWVRPFHTCLICFCFIIIYTTALDASTKEPSCDELRTMWRFSKRQSRAAEMTNEIPTYRDPFAFNIWEEYARPRSAGRGSRYKKPPVYATLVPHSRAQQSAENFQERTRAFEEVMRLFGSSLPWAAVPEGVPRRRTSFRFGGKGNSYPFSTQSGSFQHLKELIRNERARELQEQRMTEEAEHSSAVKQYNQYARMNDAPPPSNKEAAFIREKPSIQGKGVVAFPDIMLPASYNYYGDFLRSDPHVQKYRHKFPETNSV